MPSPDQFACMPPSRKQCMHTGHCIAIIFQNCTHAVGIRARCLYHLSGDAGPLPLGPPRLEFKRRNRAIAATDAFLSVL